MLLMALSPLLGQWVDLYALPSALLWMGAALVAPSFVFLALYRDEPLPAAASP